MKRLTSLCTVALMLVSSLGFALPKVNQDVMTEVKSVDTIISGLQDYQNKFWAIGLNGDTLQPDGFQKFFADRDLAFKYFVRSMSGVTIGESSAYQDDIETLQAYRSKIIMEEMAEIERITKELTKAQQEQGSVGFTKDGVQPDQFIKFFGERGLDIHFFVQGPEFSLGDVSAYEQNLKVLRDYAESLKGVEQTPDQK